MSHDNRSPARDDAQDDYPGRIDAATPATETVSVSEVFEADHELLETFNRLLPQLSSSSPPLTLDDLRHIVESPSTVLLAARLPDGTVVGSMTLAVFRLPTGVRAWIEDVIVDDDARGQGVGAALIETALGHARKAGARSIDLTSRPSREAANRLYCRLGFATRDTNVYRYQVE